MGLRLATGFGGLKPTHSLAPVTTYKSGMSQGASLKNLENHMGQLAQSLRENLPKSFPSDTEKNPKQCMVVTLRSGKELDEPKKDDKTENQMEHKNLEVEEKIEAKENKVGVELNNKGKEQKSDVM